MSELIRLTHELADPSLPQLVEALRFLFALITLSDEVEQVTLHLHPRERERGIATRLRSQALSQIASLSSRQELGERRQAILSPFEEAPQDKERPVLRIGLIGDPYCIPKYEDLKELSARIGKEYPKEIYDKQFAFYVDNILARIDLQEGAYRKEKNIPAKLFEVYREQRKGLEALKAKYGPIVAVERLIETAADNR